MKTAVLICPGRGTYTKAELGSLTEPSLMRAFWPGSMPNVGGLVRTA